MKPAKAQAKTLETPPSALEKWRHAYIDELEAVDKEIKKLTESRATLIPELSGHIISSGGKRLRPILTIFSAKLCGYRGDAHIHLAAAIEFIHTATLLHDDVVDDSKLRRGSKTANNLWGNSASVLVGDFLLSKAFQLMAEYGSKKALRILSDTSAIISEGEVLQLMMAGGIRTDEKIYMDIITAKTAQLFSAACEIGAVIAKKSAEEENALAAYGLNLGIAFQIVDDALDYSAHQEELGKTIGDDFREGKVTLPAMLAYSRADNRQKMFWRRTLGDLEQGAGDLEEAIEYIKSSGALEDSMKKAREYAAKGAESLAFLAQNQEKQALLDLLNFSVDRPY